MGFGTTETAGNTKRSGTRRRLARPVVRFWLALGILAGITNAALAMDWATYRNSAYGFSVDYPTQLFASQTFSTNGDGTTLYGLAGWIEFRAYAFNNGDELALETIVDITLEGATNTDATYRRVSDDFAVLSGTVTDGQKGERVFYRRFQPSSDLSRVAVFELFYPVRKRAQIDPLLARIGTSLTAPKNLN
ncbi:MAG: hypothetical protein AAFO98_11975 [Pseudomonadota bacterium]